MLWFITHVSFPLHWLFMYSGAKSRPTFLWLQSFQYMWLITALPSYVSPHFKCKDFPVHSGCGFFSAGLSPVISLPTCQPITLLPFQHFYGKTKKYSVFPAEVLFFSRNNNILLKQKGSALNVASSFKKWKCNVIMSISRLLIFRVQTFTMLLFAPMWRSAGLTPHTRSTDVWNL